MRRLALAEFLGTFIIVLLGTGAMIVNDSTSGALGHLGVCLIWGLAVSIAILVCERIDSGHFNPSVSLIFLLRKEVSAPKYFFRFVWQCAGALSASLVLHALFPANITLGATIPKLGEWYVFGIEVLISCFLMSTILWTGRRNKSAFVSAVIIGIAVFLAALAAGPYTGASMNPARTLGPALISGTMTGLWIYLTAPFLGMLIAIPIDRFLARTFR